MSDDLARTAPFPERPTIDAPALETARARVFVIPAGAPAPEGCDLVLPLADGARVAYVPRDATGTLAREALVDPFVRGNAFRPLHDSDRAQAALLSLAASRRLETGPESERVFVFLRGNGLLFLDNGDTHKFAPNTLGVVPAGEPAKLWAQGPDDMLAVVIQPKGEAQPRRTLAGEILRRRQPS